MDTVNRRTPSGLFLFLFFTLLGLRAFSACVGTQTGAATPLPVNGTYTPGQVVTFCYSINGYTQTGSNWFHGLTMNFGAGWDISTFTVTMMAASGDGSGNWAYYPNGQTSSSTSQFFGAGFYYDSQTGGPLDGNPGNNFGDNCTSCTWTFCFSIAVSATATQGQSLNLTVTPTGDGVSGSWGTFGCNDPAFNLSSATVSAPTLNATVVKTDATCNGLSNGTATISVVNATAPITYIWSTVPSQSTAAVTGLPAGNYSCTVSDATNTSATVTVTIGEPNPVAVTGSGFDVSCNGICDGRATASVSGGTAPYSYIWNTTPAQTTANSTGLCAGAYIVSVTDINSCSGSGTFTVNEPAVLVVDLVAITNVRCFGDNTGSITVDHHGGNTGNVTYDWSNIFSGATNSGLVAATYTVTATDILGCTALDNYTVTQPASGMVIDSVVAVAVSCPGNSDGSLTAYVSGGVLPYIYSWTQQSNNQTYSGSFINGLPGDTYTLTVTEANACSATASYQITEPPALTFTQSSTNVLCNGGNTGSATITITSGTAPYNYDWNGTGPTSNATLSGLNAGNVNVTITDANCSATATFNITEPAPLLIALASQTDVGCFGGNNGGIAITVGGGTNPGTPLWSNGQTGNSVSGLSAGTISVTVTDANACEATQTYTISEPSELKGIIIPHDATCYDASNGSSDVIASGGTIPYTYLWKDFQSTSTISQLHAGNYYCTVTDANSCSISLSTTINEPENMIISISVTAVKCFGNKDGTISVSATGGTGPYNFSCTQDFTNFVYATNGVIQGLAVGTYTVIVADNNGCTKTVPATIPNASQDNFATSSDSTSCYGADYNDGAAYITATTLQNGPYQFGIDGGPVQYSGDFYNLLAGSHVFTAINNYGCESEVPVFVFEPLPIVVDVIPDTVVLPLGESQAVQVNYLNASNVTYAWTPSEGLSCTDCPDPTVAAFHRGDYVITVSTQNGTSTCFGSATLHVEVEPHKPVFIPNSFSPNGDGNNDLFLIFGEDIETVDLKIFDRWGELVFKTNNMFSGWDGTYRGQLALPQVFTYVAKVTFLDHKKAEKEGTIMLLR